MDNIKQGHANAGIKTHMIILCIDINCTGWFWCLPLWLLEIHNVSAFCTSIHWIVLPQSKTPLVQSVFSLLSYPSDHCQSSVPSILLFFAFFSPQIFLTIPYALSVLLLMQCSSIYPIKSSFHTNTYSWPISVCHFL